MKNRLIALGIIFTIIIGILLFSSILYSNIPQNEPLEDYSYSLIKAFPNLTFSQPVGIYTDSINNHLQYVVEQKGVIILVNNYGSTSNSSIFLDISDRVLYGGEQGLLGLAFHPDYESNGHFYVNYITDKPRRTVISQFSRNEDSSVLGNISSEKILLEINQPYSNHNGGQIAFGPDSYLYIGMGDGGSGGDPHNHGQNLSTLLGSILRIDVNLESHSLTYGIPADNPFVGNTQGYREEIYAYGFRNPWRFSFDSVSGELWLADVGQNRFEEIDVIIKGGNYGWRILEGSSCYNPASDCDKSGLLLPIWEYDHTKGISITGGYVYRGSELVGLNGYYIYGDYGSGRIWALKVNETDVVNSLLLDTDLNISSFGVDFQSELFVCSYDGLIYKFNQTSIKNG